MAVRGTTTFQKRQKEIERKERQQEKFAKRLARKKERTPVPPVAAGDARETGVQP